MRVCTSLCLWEKETGGGIGDFLWIEKTDTTPGFQRRLVQACAAGDVVNPPPKACLSPRRDQL